MFIGYMLIFQFLTRNMRVFIRVWGMTEIMQAAAPPPAAIDMQPQNPVYVIPQVEALSPPPYGMVLGRSRSQWAMIRRMLGLVLISFLLMNFLMLIPMGIMTNEGDITFVAGLCSIPLLLLFFFVRRPRLVHVMLAEPDDSGNIAHPLPGDRTLTTPIKTRFRHHLLRDSTLLDIPTTSSLWSIFFLAIATAITLFILLIASPDNGLLLNIAILVGIPCWLIGFAIPVFAWMSYSTRRLGLPTRTHHAEAALTAGFVSTFPAVVINSLLFPMLLNVIDIDPLSALGEFLIVTISAPVGEEICKAAAVLSCHHLIDSPRRGFQVGFTVGLGFALLENILYISGSLASGGFIGFAFTAFLRGIGSIPGHAVWTGISGLGIGWLLAQKPSLGGLLAKKSKPQEGAFVLIDSKTGNLVHDATGSGIIGQPGSMTMWNVSSYLTYSKTSKRPHWNLPKTPLVAIFIAILGHAIWNGSTSAITFFFEQILGETGAIIAMLAWIIVLITILLWGGRRILESLHSVPCTIDNDFNEH